MTVRPFRLYGKTGMAYDTEAARFLASYGTEERALAAARALLRVPGAHNVLVSAMVVGPDGDAWYGERAGYFGKDRRTAEQVGPE